jgi:hypothetical protein
LLDIFLYNTDLVISYLWLHAIAACTAGELNSAAAQLSWPALVYGKPTITPADDDSKHKYWKYL